MKYDANRLGNGKKTMSAEQIKEYVEENAGSVDAYTKEETNTLLNGKQDVLTAGTGIDITDDTISVDDTVVQGKLTSGDGINITGDVISLKGWVECDKTTLRNDIDLSKYVYLIKIMDGADWVYTGIVADDCDQLHYTDEDQFCAQITKMKDPGSWLVVKNNSCSIKTPDIVSYTGYHIDVTIKCYDLGGTEIDSTTISNYITVSGNWATVTTPFIAAFTYSNGSFYSFVTVGTTTIKGVGNYSNYRNLEWTISVYNLINTFGQQTRVDYTAVSIISGANASNFKIYKKEKQLPSYS